MVRLLFPCLAQHGLAAHGSSHLPTCTRSRYGKTPTPNILSVQEQTVPIAVFCEDDVLSPMSPTRPTREMDMFSRQWPVLQAYGGGRRTGRTPTTGIPRRGAQQPRAMASGRARPVPRDLRRRGGSHFLENVGLLLPLRRSQHWDGSTACYRKRRRKVVLCAATCDAERSCMPGVATSVGVEVAIGIRTSLPGEQACSFYEGRDAAKAGLVAIPIGRAKPSFARPLAIPSGPAFPASPRQKARGSFCRRGRPAS